MGNFLIRRNKMIIKVIKTNSEVLEYKPPVKDNQVLSQHANHAISGIFPVVRHLEHEPPVTSLEHAKNPKTSVKIKLVITKQELGLMLNKGKISVGDLVSHIGKNGSLIKNETRDGKWKPRLESIPESN